MIGIDIFLNYNENIFLLLSIYSLWEKKLRLNQYLLRFTKPFTTEMKTSVNQTLIVGVFFFKEVLVEDKKNVVENYLFFVSRQTKVKLNGADV